MQPQLAQSLLLAAGLLMAFGCSNLGPTNFDFDGDGSLDEDDCQPADPTIFPNAPDPEDEDGVDSNCDGHNGVDSDGDGWASNATEPDKRDCNDEDPLIHPNATDEVDEVAIDSNCDGLDGIDTDSDGYASLVSGGHDCDDSDPALTPADDDGDSYSSCTGDCDDNNPALSPADSDGDGFSSCSDDCDDSNEQVNPAQTEICDLLDNNCDGVQAQDEVDDDLDGDPACSDCDDSDPLDDNRDVDGDLFSACAGDCDDEDPTIYPGAQELWGDAIDQDCDGIADSAGTSCTASFTLSFPDGTSTTLEGCGPNWSLEGDFDYLAVDPPQFTSLGLEFDWVPDHAGDDDDSAGEDSNDFVCAVSITQANVCGSGYYDAANDGSEISYQLQDCSASVGPQYRQTYQAASGYLRIDSLDTGMLGGNFSGQPLTRAVTGFVSVDDGAGVQLSGSFSLTEERTASSEVQTATCALAIVDEDGDGALAGYFGGDDCDDDNASIYPGASELFCNGSDEDCDGQDHCTYSELATSSSHNCAIDSNAQVQCWGANYSGQGTPPTGVFTEFTRLSTDYSHTCGINTLNDVLCWGNNNHGKATPPAGSFVEVSAGYTHSCAIDSSGQLHCWGQGDGTGSTDCTQGYCNQAVPPAGTFTAVDVGKHYSCAIASNGDLQCWGYLSGGAHIPPNGTFTALSVGSVHACAINSSGFLHCWGVNDRGQSSVPPGTFVQVDASSGFGTDHTCAIDSSAQIQCWGGNQYGQLNSPSGTFNEVQSGAHHSCAITSSGQLQCWGTDDTGQISPP